MPPYNAPNQRPPAPRNELLEFYHSIPPITRALLTAGIVVPVAPMLGLTNIYSLLLSWKAVTTKFQLWRLATCFFVNRIDINLAFSLFFIYRSSSQLESEQFLGRTADYLYFIMVTSGVQLVAAYFLDQHVLSSGLMMAVSYLWSQKYRGMPVSFMFGLRFQAQYLPLVQIGYEFLLGGGGIPIASMLGCASAYLYDYFTTEYPRAAGVRLLETPNWLRSLFPATTGNRGGFAANVAGAANVNVQAGQAVEPVNSIFGRHQWGRGQRLG